MTKVKYAVIYNYDRTDELRQDGTAFIYIRAYLKGKNKFFATKINVKPNQWDKKARRIVNHYHQHEYNAKIAEQLRRIEAFELEVVKREGTITLERLDDYTNDQFIDLTFTDFYEQQMEKAAVSRDSYTDQRQTLMKLKEFRKVVYFSTLSYKFVNEFEIFLIKEKNLHTNTVAKHHKNLKKYINLAIQYDYFDINRSPYKRFKIKREPTERVYLTYTELKLFEQLEIPNDKLHLTIIKDFFLFCCYTGFRYSDASRVAPQHFTETSEGMELYLKAQKTKKPYQQNIRELFRVAGMLESRPEAIVKKYRDLNEALWGNESATVPLFRKMTDQYINRELKTLAAMLPLRANVKESISTHTGRHTFGTIMAGKVPLPTLQTLMQHSNLKETQIYIHNNRQATSQALAKVEW